MRKSFERAFALALSLAALTGCTTTYVGHKLPSNGALPAGQPSGVPFVMTRPEFSVDIAPDSTDPTKAVYTLKSSDVPDPTQRYTIALDPALLVDGTFELTFGEQGNLTGATATSTSRVVATLESVVSFAINKAAPGVAKDMGNVLTQYRILLTASADPACAKKGKSKAINLEIDAFLQQLFDEAKDEQKDADPKKADAIASSLASARFHYLTADQKSCLVAVASVAASGMQQPINSAQTTYDNALKKAKADPAAKDATSVRWLKSFEEAVKALDVDAIDTLDKAGVPKGVKGATGAGKALANAKLDGKKLALLGNQFAYMPADVWRARHLQYVERQLAQLRLERLVESKEDAKAREARIAQLESEWATTLGDRKLVERVSELDKFLAQVRVVAGSAGNAPRYAAAEYVQLRTERDTLQDRVDKLRNDLVAKNKVVDPEPEKKKVEPRTDVHVKLVKPSFITAVAANPGVAADLPEFVLVIEPIAEPTVLPDPTVPAKKGGN